MRLSVRGETARSSATCSRGRNPRSTVAPDDAADALDDVPLVAESVECSLALLAHDSKRGAIGLDQWKVEEGGVEHHLTGRLVEPGTGHQVLESGK